MTPTVLPYVYAYKDKAAYCRAVSKVSQAWHFMFRDSGFKKPADMWDWSWSQDIAEECHQLHMQEVG